MYSVCRKLPRFNCQSSCHGIGSLRPAIASQIHIFCRKTQLKKPLAYQIFSNHQILTHKAIWKPICAGFFGLLVSLDLDHSMVKTKFELVPYHLDQGFLRMLWASPFIWILALTGRVCCSSKFGVVVRLPGSASACAVVINWLAVSLLTYFRRHRFRRGVFPRGRMVETMQKKMSKAQQYAKWVPSFLWHAYSIHLPRDSKTKKCF